MKRKTIRRAKIIPIVLLPLFLSSCEITLRKNLTTLGGSDSIESLSYYQLDSKSLPIESFCPKEGLGQALKVLNSYVLTKKIAVRDYFFCGQYGIRGYYTQGGYFNYDTCGYQSYDRDGNSTYDGFIAIHGTIFKDLSLYIKEIPESRYFDNYWNWTESDSQSGTSSLDSRTTLSGSE